MRARFLALVLLLTGMWFGAAPVAAQQMVTVTDWFKLSAEMAEYWDVSEVEKDHVRITPKWPGAVERARRIEVIYPRLSSAYDVAISTILETLQQRDVSAVMEVRNFRNNAARGHEVLKTAIAAKPDQIVGMGSEAVEFIYDNYKGGTIPVVTVCAKDPVSLGQMKDYERGSGTNFVFTSLNMPIDVQMAYLLELKPNLRNVSLLVDSRNTSAIETQERPIADASRKRNINVVSGLVQDPAKSREELERLIPNAIREMRRTDPELKNSVFIITGSTAVFREIETISRLAGRVPVLSVVPEVVRAGDQSAAVSIGISFESNARLAASYMLQVLENPSRASQLRVGIVSPPDISINFRRTRAIGLKIPFSFLEAASFVFDHEGKAVRVRGQVVGGLKAPASTGS